MLTTRPLPTVDEPIRHIHELVEIEGDGRVRAPVLDFLLSELSEDEQADMYARFSKLERFAFFSLPRWPEHRNWFKHLQNVGDCWEVGNDDRVRFYGFRHRDLLVLATASKKRGRKTPKKDLDDCVALRDRFKAQRP